MQHFSVIAAKGAPIADDVAATAAAKAVRALPFASTVVDQRLFRSRLGRTAVIWASNESTFEHAAGLDPGEPVGDMLPLVYGELSEPRALSRLAPTPTIHRAINQMSGRFAGGVVNLAEDTFALATTLVRLDPLYVVDDDDLVVVSTWAGAAQAAWEAIRSTPRRLGSIYSFLNAGFFGDDSTFYGDVDAIAPYATAYFADGRFSVTSEFFDFLAHPQPAGSSTYEDIAGALVEGCRPLRELDRVNLSLSGGKDSRLVLAALAAADVDAEATTTSGGSHNFTDVHCAKLVAEHVGIPHTVRPLAAKTADVGTTPDDFYRRTRDILRASDNGIISLGNLTFDPRYRGTPVLNGLGGELLRGGYSKGLNKVKIQYTPESLLISKWGRFKTLFRDDVVAEYENGLRGWLREAPHELSLREAADFGYPYCRMGRWGAALSRTGVLSRRPVYPLLDNRFMSLVYSTPVESRTNDRMLYEVLRRLAPGLADLPLANDYWAFQNEDEVRALKTQHPDAFHVRGAPATGPNLDWRANWIEVVGPELKDRILRRTTQASPLFDIVDRAKLEALFAENRVNYGHRFPLFGMYAATIAIEEEGLH